jgi:hypothetical protein
MPPLSAPWENLGNELEAGILESANVNDTVPVFQTEAFMALQEARDPVTGMIDPMALTPDLANEARGILTQGGVCYLLNTYRDLDYYIYLNY